jgi:hypothetical protein
MTYDKFVVYVTERTGPRNHEVQERFEYDNISEAREKFLCLQLDLCDRNITLVALDGEWRLSLASASVNFLSADWIPEKAPAEVTA